MRHRVIAAALVTLVVASSSVFAGGIGLFSTPDGSNDGYYSDITVNPYVPVNIYVLYLGQGGPQATGVEYRIRDVPGTLGVHDIATLIPAPASNLTLGTAFHSTGHNVRQPHRISTPTASCASRPIRSWR